MYGFLYIRYMWTCIPSRVRVGTPVNRMPEAIKLYAQAFKHSLFEILESVGGCRTSSEEVALSLPILTSKLTLVSPEMHESSDGGPICGVLKIEGRALPIHQLELPQPLSGILQGMNQTYEIILVRSDALARELCPFREFSNSFPRIVSFLGVQTKVSRALQS